MFLAVLSFESGFPLLSYFQDNPGAECWLLGKEAKLSSEAWDQPMVSLGWGCVAFKNFERKPRRIAKWIVGTCPWFTCPWFVWQNFIKVELDPLIMFREVGNRFNHCVFCDRTTSWSAPLHVSLLVIAS